jgi:hypothetical protein
VLLNPSSAPSSTPSSTPFSGYNRLNWSKLPGKIENLHAGIFGTSFVIVVMLHKEGGCSGNSLILGPGLRSFLKLVQG